MFILLAFSSVAFFRKLDTEGTREISLVTKASSLRKKSHCWICKVNKHKAVVWDMTLMIPHKCYLLCLLWAEPDLGSPLWMYPGTELFCKFFLTTWTKTWKVKSILVKAKSWRNLRGFFPWKLKDNCIFMKLKWLNCRKLNYSENMISCVAVKIHEKIFYIPDLIDQNLMVVDTVVLPFLLWKPEEFELQ